MRRIVDRNATPEETANMIIGSGKIGAAGLPVKLADRLEQVLGAGSEQWSDIRSAMWQKASRVRNTAGEVDTARSAASVADLANSSLGRRMFSPQELMAMRNHAQGVRDLERVIQNLPETAAATRARTLYDEAFSGDQLSGSQRAVFRRMVDGTATSEETAKAIFSVIGGGNPGDAVRALQAIERIVGRNSPVMGDVRTGVWQRLTQNAAGKDQQGQQKLVQGINDFLNGQGRTISRQLYSDSERALMRRYAEAVRLTIIPKYARTNSDTAPALMAAVRKYAGMIGTALGMVTHGADPTGGLMGYGAGKAADTVLEKITKARQTKKLGDSLDDIIPSNTASPPPRARSAAKVLPMAVHGGPDQRISAALRAVTARNDEDRRRAETP